MVDQCKYNFREEKRENIGTYVPSLANKGKDPKRAIVDPNVPLAVYGVEHELVNWIEWRYRPPGRGLSWCPRTGWSSSFP
jgi:hypothetical protein